MKGQAAVEFLTTYGWGLIGVVIVVVALVFVASTNPDIFTQDQCQFGSQLICTDHDAHVQNLSVLLKNGYGEPIVLNNPVPTLLPTGLNSMACTLSQNQLAKGETVRITCLFPTNLDKGVRARFGIMIPIQKKAGSPVHNITGVVHAKLI